MSEDAPSPLHRALRWSIPGAAMLSMPLGAWLHPQLMALLGLRFVVPWESLILPIGFLLVITPITSCLALYQIAHEKVGTGTGLVALFNLMTLLLSGGLICVSLLSVVWPNAGWFPRH